MLPVQERVYILSRRIQNLKRGAGDYARASNRAQAIQDAEVTLAECLRLEAYQDWRKKDYGPEAKH